MYSPSPKAKRIEVRFPDPSCNGYMAFAAMLMAGLDGIERKLDPGQPLDKDIYALTRDELKDVPCVPGSLEEALEALRKDHEFLLKGDVFSEDVIETWIEYKYDRDVNPDAAPPASLRVRAVLRLLSGSSASRERKGPHSTRVRALSFSESRRPAAKRRRPTRRREARQDQHARSRG